MKKVDLRKVLVKLAAVSMICAMPALGAYGLYAYKSDNTAGCFYYGTTDWEGEPVYVNGDITIIGAYINDEDEDELVTEKFNLNLKKGWNMAYHDYREIGRYESEYEITTQPPSGTLKWNYDDWSFLYENTGNSRLQQNKRANILVRAKGQKKNFKTDKK